MSLDLTQFHDSFFEESFEAIASMEDALLKLDVGTPDPDLINTIFRVAHSIKGGAATFGFNEVASFTHTLETLLDELRSNKMQVTPAISDLLLRSVDVMREMLRAVQTKQPADAQRVADLQFDLECAVLQRNQQVASAPAMSPSAVASMPVSVATAIAPVTDPGTISGKPRWRVSFKPYLQLMARGNDPLRMFGELAQLGDLEVHSDVSQIPALEALDPENCHVSWVLEISTDAPKGAITQCFDWAEGDCELKVEPIPEAVAAPTPAVTAAAAAAVEPASRPAVEAAVPTAGKASDSPKAADASKAAGSDSSSIRVSIEKIDELMNIVGELVITQSMLSQIGHAADGPGGERLRNGFAQLERNVRELQESVMRVRMVPISFVFSRFPRMVRDLAQRLGKQVELKMTGGETELDKTVLEKIGDPLVHLVRNGIDHGIESAEVRAANGKPAVGTVHLHAYHKGGNITVEVSDDGGGLNRDRIIRKAKEKSLVATDAELTDSQAYDLIFMPGFSTNDQATDISGRGVGMDVVRRNIEELGGSVEIRSTLGQGSRFIINLPLTLAIVDGQTISAAGESYIVPLTAIVESLQLKSGMLKRIVGRGEVFSFRGDYLPVVRLSDVFHVRDRSQHSDGGLIMVVEGEGRRVGVCVDELLGQQQVVVKTLETNYGRVDGVAGATILGDGSVALILDIGALTRRFSDRAAA